MTYGWINLGGGRQVYRRIPDAPPKQRSHLARPSLIRDFAEPVQSMADGKYYTSKRALAQTAKASHNPHGVDFVELGNEEMPWVEHKESPDAVREDIRAAQAALDNGWRPDVAILDD